MASRSTILTCLATSPRGMAVASEGLRFAAMRGARPVFLNVGSDEPQRREALGRLVREAGKNDLAPEDLLIRPGEPYAVITRAAKELATEMIVLGALSRDPAWVSVWGSVARKVARGAPCSVLLLSAPALHHAADRIVAGVQFDAESAAAMPLILRVAREGHAESVHFVHEFAVSEARFAAEETGERGVTSDDYIVRQQVAERHMLADFLSAYNLNGIDVRMASLPGRQGMEVVAYARRHQADLIILPTPRRRLTFWDRFFRHPLESVLRDLPCALLLSRPTQQPDVDSTNAVSSRMAES